MTSLRLMKFIRIDIQFYFQLEAILSEHGLVVITRSGTNPEKFIFESDLLTKYRVS